MSAVSTETTKAKLDEARNYLDRIKKLQDNADFWMSTTLICCLARYYTVAGDFATAKSAVSKVIAASIAILSDGEEANDWFAYLQMGRILEALQGEDNIAEAWNGLQSLMTPEAASSRWFLCDECRESIPLCDGVYVSLDSFVLMYFHQGCYDSRSVEVRGRSSCGHKVATISIDATHTRAATPKEKQERETSLDS
ncbi:hypothetical protein BDV96DRAFT_647029 [Lophiotrema nucula]|uniref:Uncharacterized protein n=1 Tax=Lophiotrema nucula TaxID=690887 RepID=A0A6A5Z5M7_9PLEO|nr:hypothetical protein BDV96DRAFT_647029 [Lophiotrema nucula]